MSQSAATPTWWDAKKCGSSPSHRAAGGGPERGAAGGRADAGRSGTTSGFLFRRITRTALLIVAALLPAGTAAAQGTGRLLYWWTQAGAAGEWQVRTVYDGGAVCPGPATVRALPDTAFPVLVCQQVVGEADGEARAGGRRVGRPVAARRVVVIGDTGCRARDQNCADPGSWPFARVAAAAARAGGDLTIHVGDYIYRERCTAGVPGPCGDNWTTWEAEWFRPAGELLAAAPWVFARGNHEDCNRGGRGWFRFFDPRAVPASGCEKTTEPYAVPVPGLGRLLILDSACAPWYSDCWPGRLPDGRAGNDSATAVRTYAAQLRRLAELARGNEDAWLVTHVPVWGVDQPGHPDSVGSYLLQAALRQVSRGALPAAVTLQVVGHTHIWEMIAFAGGRPPVLVAGNGGTSEGTVPAVPPGAAKVIDGAAVAGFWKTTAFGYTLLEPVGPGWRATLRPIESACTLSGGRAIC